MSSKVGIAQVNTAINIGIARSRDHGSTPGKGTKIFFPQSVQTDSGEHLASYEMDTGRVLTGS